ncbi:MAG: ribosome recycling factor [Phycisphaeraceae bacterium]|nr:MAG: ribosome recycling factor [Phycisphaeraceae bacterium]
MSTDPDTILLEAEEQMDKAVKYLEHEFKGLRTGRASTALVDSLKADYYGSPTELKAIAAISVPEPSQLLIKPFDAGALSAIKHAIEASGLGLNPISEGKQLRVNIPALSAERRTQLIARAKKIAEEQKIAIRNTRRDANKHADALSKASTTHYAEDDIKQLKDEIQDLTKKHEDLVDKKTDDKIKEIQTV